MSTGSSSRVRLFPIRYTVWALCMLASVLGLAAAMAWGKVWVWISTIMEEIPFCQGRQEGRTDC